MFDRNIMNRSQAEVEIARFGLKAARAASAAFRAQGLSAADVARMPITDIYDEVRDQAYDLLVAAEMDEDEWLLDVTDEGVSILS